MDESIKSAVREHYGKAIQSAGSCCGGGSSCCGDDQRTEVLLYGQQALASLPSEVVTTSFGCGNPLAIASLRPGEVVLDLGSGGGLDVMLAAQRVGAQGYVYGLDMTDEMLATARRNIERAGVANAEFLKGEIEDIPLPNASVDVIISNCVINLSPDKAQVLREAQRVLRPGGRLAVSDIVVDGDLSDLPVDEATLRSALSWVGCIAGAIPQAEYTRLLAEAGFENIDMTVKHRYTIEDLGEIPEQLATLDPVLLGQIAQRFVSSAISAQKQ
ncbi:arsenite methyltransferase [Chloroflexia bacterium SDU3-3]|nr:arsenite methyltransferase [Chloroflexia bacterium SDU3-3]